MKQGKVWGTTEELFNNGVVSIHCLKINKGGFSSKHRHQFKSNLFYGISGNLKVEIWTDPKLKDETVVWPGESHEVAPLVYHRFTALTDVVCFEIYETKLRGEDIKRDGVGGIKEI